MLASILANLQNLPLVPERLPMVKIDRGGGGPLWGPRYDIVDIMTAAQSFPEIAGEDGVSRAVRRTRWIGDRLAQIGQDRDQRERRDAAAFLAGASLAASEAEERHRQIDQLRIAQVVQIVDEVRGAPAPAMPMPRDRGQPSGGGSTGTILIALGIGVAIGALLVKSSRSRARRSLA